jgi:hypothetical protein
MPLVVGLAACAPHPPARPANDAEAVVRRYYDMNDKAARQDLLADEFRMWFETKEGDGTTKAELADNAWDDALHARSRIVALHAEGRTVTVQAHEDNDFSLLLGYPGWDPTITYEVSPEGRITSALYLPRGGAPSWRASLDAALPWLREHRADSLVRIYPDGKLVRTRETALEWVQVLRDWRQATGQPDPTRP